MGNQYQTNHNQQPKQNFVKSNFSFEKYRLNKGGKKRSG